MNIESAFVVLSLGLLAILVWRHFQAGELAYKAARAHTQKQGVLLLDQTIILKRIRLKFSRQRLCQIERHFEFEFATVGDVRYRGFVTIVGHHIGRVQLQPFKDLSNEHSS